MGCSPAAQDSSAAGRLACMACSSVAPSWSWARSPRPAELGASNVAGADVQPRPDDVDDEHDQVQRRVHLKRQPTVVPRCRARRGRSRVSARAAAKAERGTDPPSAADAFKTTHKTKSCSSAWLPGCQTNISVGILRTYGPPAPAPGPHVYGQQKQKLQRKPGRLSDKEF